ncbi:MAG: SPOR domain-containing protein [Gemmobacter sp.]|nr:SPOR domain-containing protein [Gemmobacter sp.]
MAEVDFEEHGPAAAARAAGAKRRTRRLINLVGALLSVALLVWAGVWGYKSAMRSVMGVPLIKAAAGPMRIAPENPGGEQAAHQGLSVNDVAAFGVATPLPEEIVLAPRAEGLMEEDGPGLAPEPPAALVARPEPEGPPQPLLPVAEAAPPAAVAPVAPGTEADTATDAPALAGPAVEGAAPPGTTELLAEELAGAEPVPPLPLPEPVAEPAFVPAPVVPGGIGASLRPLPRPGGMAVLPVANAPVEVREVDPATLKPGTRLVQFGAFDSPDQAKEHWGKLSATFGELMVGKAQVIQSAESGGRTFYRLRAEGFTDEADARRFCAAVTAVGPECIPVAVR